MTYIASPRLLYRVRQFWHALHAQPSAHELALARAVLSPQQFNLFSRMQPSEQVHSLGVLQQLQENANPPQDLQIAALLHDVGKSILPLRLWERAWIVLASAVAPSWAQHRGSQAMHDDTPFWQRPLIVACQHPEWGARLAEEAEAPPLAVAIIRRHQQKITPTRGSFEEELLLRLQAVDDRN